MRAAPFTVMLLAFAISGAAQNSTPPPSQPRQLSLDLDRIFELREEPGHAEFDSRERRLAWRDPMIRLSLAVDRELWVARRGGLTGSGVPWSLGINLGYTPGADLRLVLAGPWAEDWHELSTPEKIGRAAEGAAVAGLFIGMLNWLR